MSRFRGTADQHKYTNQTEVAMIPNIGFDVFCGTFPPIRISWENSERGHRLKYHLLIVIVSFGVPDFY